MNTIFDGYKKLNDKQIINQMAILETINLSNVFMFSKNKFKESTIHTIKRLLGTERENPEDKNTYKTKEEQVNELYELLKESRKELRKLTRQALDIKLKLLLCDRSGSKTKETEEIISLDIVNEVSKRFSLSEYLTPAQKMDRIYDMYNEKILDFLKENPDSDLIDSDNALDLTDPKFLIHIFTDTIKSWDLIQGSKNIDREVLAESIWILSMHCEEYFTPKTEELPSSKIELESDNTYLEDTVFFGSVNIFNNSKNELEINDYKLSDLSEEMDKYDKVSVSKQTQLIALNEKQKNTEKKNREIEVDLDYIGNIYDPIDRENKKNKLREDHIRIKEQYKADELKILKLQNDIKEVNKFLNDLNLDKEYLLDEEKKLKDFRNEARRQCLIEEDKRYDQIKSIWLPHFNKFEIETQFIKESVGYTTEERIEIERVLEELHRLNDPRIISNNFVKEELNNNYNIEFELERDRIVCLEYNIDEEQRVKLLRILESIE